MLKPFFSSLLALTLLGAGCFSSSPTTDTTNITPTPTPLSTPPLPPTSTIPLITSTSTSISDAILAKKDLIQVTNLTPGQQIKNGFIVQGKARGPWYFEASFPFELKNANGTVLASGPVQAQGEWMTTNFVPFTLPLTFSTPGTATGTLVLKKDNPSGLPEHEDALVIPVTF